MPVVIIALLIIFGIILFKVYSNNDKVDFKTEEKHETRDFNLREQAFPADTKGYSFEESNKVYATSTEIRDFFDLE
jgi:hypothetical protein